ncbi:hypothetical protein [Myceligenerans salitolerans]|uniref:Uncharacterized protein n=1 Tax=Myceligenerans salitolerans TaxID=1230528 RepID=A0ABS3I9K6_9MICO|nr:hypothetical protein [Myceligenerans salitolerans]MBO0609118.1 hypothetical protein [Myceligenerans salitolerans]
MGPAHIADVYVFAVHTTTQDELYDGLDIAKWHFYVLSGETVKATGQGSMRLSKVVRLGGQAVAWAGLRDAIGEVGSCSD